MRADTQIREKRKIFTFWPPARKLGEISGWVQPLKLSLRIEQQMPC